jgi:hypothetical protein
MQEALAQQIGSSHGSRSSSNDSMRHASLPGPHEPPAAELFSTASAPAHLVGDSMHEAEQRQQSQQGEHHGSSTRKGPEAGAGAALPSAPHDGEGVASRTLHGDEDDAQPASDSSPSRDIRHLREPSVSLTFPAGSLLESGGDPQRAAASPAAASDLDLGLASAMSDNQLTSPSQQLRGFGRSSEHGGDPPGATAGADDEPPSSSLSAWNDGQQGTAGHGALLQVQAVQQVQGREAGQPTAPSSIGDVRDQAAASSPPELVQQDQSSAGTFWEGQPAVELPAGAAAGAQQPPADASSGTAAARAHLTAAGDPPVSLAAIEAALQAAGSVEDEEPSPGPGPADALHLVAHR